MSIQNIYKHKAEADAPYLYKVDERGEYGTSKHVVFLWLLPEQGQVLNQTAYVRPDL